MEEAKIEQYCLLAKGAKGKAVAELMRKATAEPGLFAFGELLDMPHVKEVIFDCKLINLFQGKSLIFADSLCTASATRDRSIRIL